MDNSFFRNKIIENLKNTVTSDYVLLGVPKHMNLGDTLIWEAEEQLLRQVDFRCKGTYFWGENNINVTEEDIIIFSGGGSWDDIWGTIDYIEKMLLKYNKNKFIFLPNDVWYNDINRINKTIQVLNEHKNEIILFSRNQQSFEIANKHFKMVNNILIPDVVLGWDIDEFMTKNDLSRGEGEGCLLIKRNDREKITYELNSQLDKTTDWPEMSKTPSYVNNSYSCEKWSNEIKPKLVCSAINFVNKYKTVYSDRMHGGILAMLLDKEVIYINNSYNKTKSMYNTWLENKNFNCKLYG